MKPALQFSLVACAALIEILTQQLEPNLYMLVRAGPTRAVLAGWRGRIRSIPSTTREKTRQSFLSSC
jgi:hypothetical protein